VGFIADALEVGGEVVEGDLVVFAKGEDELAVKGGMGDAEHGAGDGGDGEGGALGRELPEADGALFENGGVGLEVLVGEDVEGGDELGGGGIGSEEGKEGIDGFEEALGLAVAVGEDELGLGGLLPEEGEDETFGGEGEATEGKGVAVVGGETGEEFFELGVSGEAGQEVADHEEWRSRICWTRLVVE
jgi:hypothetical protein